MDHHDEIRELNRRLSLLEREMTYIPGRPPAEARPHFVVGEAATLIDAEATGDVGLGTDVKNTTGRPIWKDAACVVWLDYAAPVLLSTNAATLIRGEFVSSLKTNIENYTDLRAAAGGHFDDDGLVDAKFEISDPGSLLTDVVAGDIVIFETGTGTTKPNKLTVVELTATNASEGGGFAWPGPGTGPNPGTATVSICIATVNSLGGVASGTAVPFDGATVVIGTAPVGGTGSAVNDTGKPFFDNETFVIVGTNAGGWSGWKIGCNIFKALVNKSGSVLETDATAGFDGATGVYGATPPASGTFDNVFTEEYADDQPLLFIQPNGNGNAIPLERGCVFGILKGVPSATVNGSGTSTFTVSSPAIVRGRAPVGAITVNNASPATVRATTSETMYYEYDRSAGSTIATRWRPSTAYNHWQRKKAISNYDETKIQVEGHNASGNETWYDTTLCNVSS